MGEAALEESFPQGVEKQKRKTKRELGQEWQRVKHW
jgi:hypothetical protein